MIRVIALDIDGVLTDGTVTLDESGRESKNISFEDIDAIFRARRAGLKVAFITGENTLWVDMIARRLEVDRLYKAALDKGAAISKLAADLEVSLDDVCYVGDSERDLAVLNLVGLPLIPASAPIASKASSHRVLSKRGGAGAVAEAIELAIKNR